MTPKDQDNFFTRLNGDHPAELDAAIMEMPQEFSGVPRSMHNLVTGRALRAKYAPEMKAIFELEDAIGTAESAVVAARDEVRIETGLDAASLTSWPRRSSGGPLLRGSGD